MLMRHVKRLAAARRPKIDFGRCWKKGCNRAVIIMLNDLGACAHHLEQLIQEQRERAHAAFRQRLGQEVAS